MIFSIKAQVYELNPDSEGWTPSTFSVVPVSFYCEPNTGRTRIIAMENTEVFSFSFSFSFFVLKNNKFNVI